MRHEQLPLHEVDVGLNAAKPAFQRVVQRSRVLVVVVGMRASERDRFRRRQEWTNEDQKKAYDGAHDFICAESRADSSHGRNRSASPRKKLVI
jgi:hypothetical protein